MDEGQREEWLIRLYEKERWNKLLLVIKVSRIFKVWIDSS